MTSFFSVISGLSTTFLSPNESLFIFPNIFVDVVLDSAGLPKSLNMPVEGLLVVAAPRLENRVLSGLI